MTGTPEQVIDLIFGRWRSQILNAGAALVDRAFPQERFKHPLVRHHQHPSSGVPRPSSISSMMARASRSAR
jgi:hypothetical protein